jgi:hypothetical protein
VLKIPLTYLHHGVLDTEFGHLVLQLGQELMGLAVPIARDRSRILDTVTDIDAQALTWARVPIKHRVVASTEGRFQCAWRGYLGFGECTAILLVCELPMGLLAVLPTIAGTLTAATPVVCSIPTKVSILSPVPFLDLVFRCNKVHESKFC